VPKLRVRMTPPKKFFECTALSRIFRRKKNPFVGCQVRKGGSCFESAANTVFVLEVVPRQRRVYSFFSINLENPISVLYSTKFHPQRNTFLPFPRPLWGTLAHPERTGAALDSSKANAPPWYFSAARLRGPSGETTAHRDLLRGC